MPVVPSSVTQERLAAMIIPIFIILGLAGLSYAIFTAVKWVPSLRHVQKDASFTKFDTEPKKGVHCLVQINSDIESCKEDEVKKGQMLGSITMIGPRVPERAVHSLSHGYR
ncbi:hypothetical protein M378DRAFT_165959 [Amanita muscaria Koide BX008]|uniref:Uncharacterized protein n=1 Tax=Amanita muscaria (strain Koide BX008) TaxID=946122 RepID=A0A0C2T6M8_AMAMK|nr:hypothetical protein M378DRAFT_165959 [Amanita muscaria Koide BX008]